MLYLYKANIFKSYFLFIITFAYSCFRIYTLGIYKARYIRSVLYEQSDLTDKSNINLKASYVQIKLSVCSGLYTHCIEVSLFIYIFKLT